MVPKAKLRGFQQGFQCVLVSPERVPGSERGCAGVLWDPRDPVSQQPCQQPRHQLIFGGEAALRHVLVAVGVADVPEEYGQQKISAPVRCQWCVQDTVHKYKTSRLILLLGILLNAMQERQCFQTEASNHRMNLSMPVSRISHAAGALPFASLCLRSCSAFAPMLPRRTR